ncbi:MAG: energy-coupled thiamine transporter ThiT [Clostridia bacterium]|nr:energy-coupled thiamine transporter ThiT [Clostridia bacterium]
MYNFLSIWSFLFTELEDAVTDTVTVISIITIIASLIALIVTCSLKGKFDTKKLVYASVSIALSFALSYVKVKVGAEGGSVTLMSVVPIFLFSYCFGVSYGLFAGIIYGLLQFLQSPYMFTWATFFLDYALAYGAIFLASVFKKAFKTSVLPVTLGVLSTYLLRIIFATMSGIMYFNAGWVSSGYPTDSAFIYSLCYNLAYLIPDMIICLIFLIPFSKSKTFTKLFN